MGLGPPSCSVDDDRVDDEASALPGDCEWPRLSAEPRGKLTSVRKRRSPRRQAACVAGEQETLEEERRVVIDARGVDGDVLGR